MSLMDASNGGHRLPEENDAKPPPPPTATAAPPAGLRWRELMQQQQNSKKQPHPGVEGSTVPPSPSSGGSSSSSCPSPSATRLLDKSYDSLTRVAVEDFLVREAAVQRWIEDCLNRPPASPLQPALCSLLSDGVVLCQLMSGLDQGSIPRIHTGKVLELGFKRRENIMFFIEALRDNKIPPGFIFHVDDLYQQQNFYRVIECLEYLSELAYKEWGAPHRKKSKDDIRRLVGQGDIQLTEEAYARTEKVLKDFLAKKKWFLAPDKAATVFGNKPTQTTAHSPAHLSRHALDPAPVVDSEPTAGATKSVGPRGKDDSPHGKERRSVEQRVHTENEDGLCSKEDEGRNEASTVNPTEEAEETDEAFTGAVSRNPWKEAEQEEKRRRAEVEEQQRRESEERRREEEQRRLADEERRRAEARRREEALVLAGAIRLQALYRGRLARTAFRSKLRAAAYRENVANEIFQTEKDYVANLGLLFDTFLHPIKEHMTGSIWHHSLSTCPAKQPTSEAPSTSGMRKSGETPTVVVTNSSKIELKEFKDLFANIQVIRNFNTKLLDDLHPRLKAWTPHQQLGDIFVQVAMFLKVYTAYVKNYDAMRRELAQAKASSPEFKQYLVECAEANRDRVGKQDINSLLIQPVQRIPRYLLLLRELAKHTQPDHKDFANINTALEQIKKVAEYIEQKSADSEKVHKMIAIQARFHGECESLIDPGRVFIREAQLLGWNVKNKRKQLYVLLLFNDLLVLARPVKENKNWRKTITISSKAKMAASVAAAGGVGHGAGGDAAHHQPQQDLVFSRSFQLRHLAPTALPDTKRGHCFGLVTEFDQPVAKFYTADPNERDEWLAELHAVKKAIVKNNKARKDVIRRTLKGRKNKSVKGLSSMAKAFEADDSFAKPSGSDTTNDDREQSAIQSGSQMLLSPRGDRAHVQQQPMTRREKTMSVMLTPSPPLHHTGGASKRAALEAPRRESLWEPATLPTHSSASALSSVASVIVAPTPSTTSSPSSSSHGVALPRSSSAPFSGDSSAEKKARSVAAPLPSSAKRMASSDVILDDSGSHHHHLKVTTGSRIRKSAPKHSPERPDPMLLLLEERDSEEWEEVGGRLSDSSSDDDNEAHDRDTTTAVGDAIADRRQQRAGTTSREEKEKVSLLSVVGDDAGEDGEHNLYGSGGSKTTRASAPATSGRTRGHARSRSATFRARLQLSPRKAFEALSSGSKKKPPKDGGDPTLASS